MKNQRTGSKILPSTASSLLALSWKLPVLWKFSTLKHMFFWLQSFKGLGFRVRGLVILKILKRNKPRSILISEIKKTTQNQRLQVTKWKNWTTLVFSVRAKECLTFNSTTTKDHDFNTWRSFGCSEFQFLQSRVKYQSCINAANTQSIVDKVFVTNVLPDQFGYMIIFLNSLSFQRTNPCDCDEEAHFIQHIPSNENTSFSLSKTPGKAGGTGCYCFPL